MIPTHQLNSKSPFINKKPNEIIANAVSNTVTAIGALNNYCVSSGASLKQINQKLTLPTNTSTNITINSNPNNEINQNNNNNNNNENQNNSSINFNGDRLVMNNTAGSRRPLTGYSSFN